MLTPPDRVYTHKSPVVSGQMSDLLLMLFSYHHPLHLRYNNHNNNNYSNKNNNDNDNIRCSIEKLALMILDIVGPKK